MRNLMVMAVMMTATMKMKPRSQSDTEMRGGNKKPTSSTTERT
jgi:hypothetical protein